MALEWPTALRAHSTASSSRPRARAASLAAQLKLVQSGKSRLPPALDRRIVTGWKLLFGGLCCRLLEDDRCEAANAPQTAARLRQVGPRQRVFNPRQHRRQRANYLQGDRMVIVVLRSFLFSLLMLSMAGACPRTADAACDPSSPGVDCFSIVPFTHNGVTATYHVLSTDPEPNPCAVAGVIPLLSTDSVLTDFVSIPPGPDPETQECPRDPDARRAHVVDYCRTNLFHRYVVGEYAAGIPGPTTPVFDVGGYISSVGLDGAFIDDGWSSFFTLFGTDGRNVVWLNGARFSVALTHDSFHNYQNLYDHWESQSLPFSDSVYFLLWTELILFTTRRDGTLSTAPHAYSATHATDAPITAAMTGPAALRLIG